MPIHANNVTALKGKPTESAPGPEAGRVASDDMISDDRVCPTQTRSPERLSAELVEAWLSWQCQMVSGVIRGAVFVPDAKHSASKRAIWPQDGNGETQLYAAATQALKQNKSVKFAKIGYGTQGQRLADFIACPVYWQDQTVAVIALAVSVRSEPQQHAVLQLMRWGGLWIETLVDKTPTGQNPANEFIHTLVAAVLAQPSLRAATIETVNALGRSFGCERVSLGLKQGLLVKLSAMSGNSTFDPRTNLVHAIESAMDEACDENRTLVESGNTAPDTPRQKAHRHLAHQHGCSSICTLLLKDQSNRQLGAITLERSDDHPFSATTLQALETVANLIAPILELKKTNEQPVTARLAQSVKTVAGRVVGPAYLRSKLTAFALATLIGLSALIDGQFEAKAPSMIEGSVSQLLVAPHHNYIKQAFARAGDRVEQGQVLATLDDRLLRLDLEKWQSELSQIDKQYQDALARRDRTELGIYQAKRDQIKAEIQLTQNALRQTQLRAPFDGIIIKGDPGQSLGAPVEIGQSLFEVAPLEDYRVLLEVAEEDIGQVTIGSQGRLMVAALPNKPLGFSVQRIVPLAETAHSRNVFRIEAALTSPSPLLRPGMRGVAKIELGERKLLWIWTHRLVERVRLWAWKVVM